jgi:hypothetical protein
MTDPNQITLAAQLVTLLAVPFAQGVAKQVGQDAFTQAKSLLASVRARFRQDRNDKALQTLDLFEGDPATFADALTRLLIPVLAAHPEWAAEIRQTLAQPAAQAIIARNDSVIEQVRMKIAGAGQQRIESDNSIIKAIDMSIESNGPAVAN